MIHIYTDGGCSPNPGKGAWAVILLHEDGTTLEDYGVDSNTTNNRMEMKAVIEALCMVSVLPETSEVTIYTDSQLVYMGITNWFNSWKARNWRTASGDLVKNKDLWLMIGSLLHSMGRRTLNWQWVRGHSGDEYNEKVDSLVQQLLTSRLTLS